MQRNMCTRVSCVESVSDSSQLSTVRRRLKSEVGSAAVAINCFIYSSRYYTNIPFRTEKSEKIFYRVLSGAGSSIALGRLPVFAHLSSYNSGI